MTITVERRQTTAFWTTEADCSRRVLRGGSSFSDPRFVRSANRSWFPTGNRDYDVGFRVARTLN